MSSLEALQQNVLQAGDEKLHQWLEQQPWKSEQRLTERLKVKAGYEKAVEIVLSPFLSAYFTGQTSVAAHQLSSLDGLPYALIHQPANPKSGEEIFHGCPALLSVVEAGFDMASLVGEVFICDSSRTNLNLCVTSFKTGQRLVTRDGLLAGNNWLLQLGNDSESHGLLAREQEIKSLKQSIAEVTEKALVIKVAQ